MQFDPSMPLLTMRPMPRVLTARDAVRHACIVGVLAMGLGADVLANDPPAPAKPAAATAPAHAAGPAHATGPVTAKEVGDQVRQALEAGDAKTKKLTLMVNGKEKKLITMPVSNEPPAEAAARSAAAAPAGHSAPVTAVAAQGHAQTQYAKARAAAHGKPVATTKAAAAMAAHAGHEAHWEYEGDNGPQAWGKLKPEFNTCATGKRQSPINIEDRETLQGPAEALQLMYTPSSASVVNNGHTIQVDVNGDNVIVVRGSTYKLLQFHFHHPSEERVNYKAFAMVAHLVHRNSEGQLAVVAVLLEPGVANALIHKVWTYMPLDAMDRVRMPPGILDLNELLPEDRRYYQFMGSLTTPPCSEGVLWMVLKKPVQISREQLRLFSQLFPNNSRPVQPLNGRVVRDAQ